MVQLGFARRGGLQPRAGGPGGFPHLESAGKFDALAPLARSPLEAAASSRRQEAEAKSSIGWATVVR